jgi:regulator of sigma E protease
MMDFLLDMVLVPVKFFKEYGGPFILVLSLLVFVHEWGHYIVARMCGVKVVSFSIGFGRELFGWTDKRGCRWKFSLIPLGGYVQMFGDTDPASAAHSETVQEGKEPPRQMSAEERKVAFFAQPVGRRAVIVLAGPAINYLFAIFILAGLYYFQGQPYVPPVAAGIMADSPAEKAGVRPDDLIVAVNGRAIKSFNELRKEAALNLDQPMKLTVRRAVGPREWEGTPVVLDVQPRLEYDVDRFGFRHATGRIGVSSPRGALEMREHHLPGAFWYATLETINITGDTLKALGQMILGVRSTEELGGILRIGAYAGDFAQKGMIAFITFAALLSVNLGFINLLPIPMLDGGHLAMYAMEKMRGKPLSEQVQEYMLRIGLLFLLFIMVFATWNDLVQLKLVDYVKSLIS